MYVWKQYKAKLHLTIGIKEDLESGLCLIYPAYLLHILDKMIKKINKDNFNFIWGNPSIHFLYLFFFIYLFSVYHYHKEM